MHLHLLIPLGKEKRPVETLPATFVLNGGGDRTRTCIAFRPAVFKTAALPLCHPSARWLKEYSASWFARQNGHGIARMTRIVHDLSLCASPSPRSIPSTATS